MSMERLSQQVDAYVAWKRELLREITRYHGAYSSAKARRDVPEFRCEVDFLTGAAHTLADVKQRGRWRSSDGDGIYDAMVRQALAAGLDPVRL